MLWTATRPWWWPWWTRCESCRVPERPRERLRVTAVPVPRPLPARPRAAVTAARVYEITDARPSRTGK